MIFYSPLRYPGGKNKLAKFISKICIKNSIDGHYVEPYAGGASVALFLLFSNSVKEITINDYDKSIYAFWHSVLNDTEKLCAKIQRTKVNMRSWNKQKAIQQGKDTESDLLKLGFSTFFLNRTNYSGIIDGGMIGGRNQESEYKIDCRFNKKELISKIRFIAQHKSQIHLENTDALRLLEKIDKNKNTIFYFDPPYYLKGPSLYLNHYHHDDHIRVCKKIREIAHMNWIVSYDNTPEIKSMYKGCRKKEYSFFHTAYNMREGKEILFYSKGLKIPRVPSPTKC